MESNITTVATINGAKIQIIQNGEKLVPVRPICEALGIDFSSQLQRLKRDEILSSTVVTTTMVGGDGKDREMVSIPIKFVFGWLFTIDTSKVREDAKEFVIKYKLECYNALYDYFARKEEFLEFRTKTIEEKLAIYDAARADFRMAKERVAEARADLDESRKLTEQDYFDSKKQLLMDFTEGGD